MNQLPSARELAFAAAENAADRKANDIVLLELGESCSVADYFVIASARSHIQVEAICQSVARGLADRFGVRPMGTEGLENAQWALLDYGDVVVHVFQERTRKVYDLERLWRHAPRTSYGCGPVLEPATA